MLTKLKKAVKYVVKKIKQGVEIVAKTINDAKCAVAKTAEVGANVVSDMYKARCEVTIKKLDMIERAGSTVCNGVKGAGSAVCNGVKNINIRNLGVMFLFVGGMCITTYILNERDAK